MNRKERRPQGDGGEPLRRAKDAYVDAYATANSHGSASPRFEAKLASFEAALNALSDDQANAFDLWQKTNVMARNASTGTVEAVDPLSMRHDPNQVADAEVVQWFKEIDQGLRVPKVLDSVRLEAIRSNPFVLEYDETTVQLCLSSLRAKKIEAWLVVARLPDGSYIDVDTPYICEALKRDRREASKVSIAGAFSGHSCSRLGLLPWAGESEQRSASVLVTQPPADWFSEFVNVTLAGTAWTIKPVRAYDAWTGGEDGLNEDLVSDIVSRIQEGAFPPMPVCVDGVPFGAAAVHVCTASAAAGHDATYCFDLEGLDREKLALLATAEEAHWTELCAFAGGSALEG
jgi:hypothetical protein